MAEVGGIHSIVGQRWPRSRFAAIDPTTLPDVITPGTGTKVTVDSKGRVIVLGTLLATDIPALAESKITGLVADLADIDTRLDVLEALTTDLSDHFYEPVTNGDVGSPEIVFSDGDVVMVRI